MIMIGFFRSIYRYTRRGKKWGSSVSRAPLRENRADNFIRPILLAQHFPTTKKISGVGVSSLRAHVVEKTSFPSRTSQALDNSAFNLSFTRSENYFHRVAVRHF